MAAAQRTVENLLRTADIRIDGDEVSNIGPHYDTMLMAWGENFRATYPQFGQRFGQRFRHVWRFYLLSCAGAFRTRSLQVYAFFFKSR